MNQRIQKIYRFSDFSLYPDMGWIFFKDLRVQLENKPFSVLLFLLENSNSVLSIDKIINYVWDDYSVEDSNVSSCIYRIRKVLKQYVDMDFIRTLHHKGYMFVGDVEFVESEFDKERSPHFETERITFQFPEELRVSCEQYLLYFVQFLQDLGINATSNIREEAGKVLFSVTPSDNIEALDKIRSALAIYLDLPSSQIVYDNSFAAMRLQQQIDNLQHSQKMVTRELQLTEKLLVVQSETIIEKNRVISQKDSTIDQQNKIIEKIISKSIMMDSLENKEEFEKVFDGLEFGESKELKEKLGIKFNPVTSLKSLGGKFIGKDDEIISLNLDKPKEEKRDGI